MGTAFKYLNAASIPSITPDYDIKEVYFIFANFNFFMKFGH